MSGIRLEVVGSACDVAARAAALVLDRIARDEAAVLGLATGRTMVPVYADLVARARSAGQSFRCVTSFNLDEYVALAPLSPASFHGFMRRHLLGQADFDPARMHLPDGMAPDLAAEAARYQAAIASAGGIDLQLLGIGTNGHIGFNEPGSDFNSTTRLVQLSEETRQGSAGDFPTLEAVPHQALTMGIGTILAAREILLLATGVAKADAIAAALEGPASTDCPASALQRHDHVRIVCDAAAASKLAGHSAANRRLA